MNLTGKYILRPSIGGTMILVETSTGPVIFATFDNSPAAQAAIGAIVSTAAQYGGTVYDEGSNQFIAGDLALMVEPV